MPNDRADRKKGEKKVVEFIYWSGCYRMFAYYRSVLKSWTTVKWGDWLLSQFKFHFLKIRINSEQWTLNGSWWFAFTTYVCYGPFSTKRTLHGVRFIFCISFVLEWKRKEPTLQLVIMMKIAFLECLSNVNLIKLCSKHFTFSHVLKCVRFPNFLSFRFMFFFCFSNLTSRLLTEIRYHSIYSNFKSMNQRVCKHTNV